jgi:hypothetical protein
MYHGYMILLLLLATILGFATPEMDMDHRPMNVGLQTFSREYLQGLPEQARQQAKKQEIDNIIRGFLGELQGAALKGHTSYMYNPTNRRPMMHSGPIVATNEDLIVAFQNKFPGCNVSYQEAWIDTSANTRVLTKGILIDWS